MNIGDDEGNDLGSNDDYDDNMNKCNDPLRGVSIALTRNYVSASNIPDVLRFLDTKVNQISGCRDRKEAVRPEELGREFRKALLAAGDKTIDDDVDVGNGGLGSDEKKCEDYDNQRQKKEDSNKGRWVDLLKRSELRANDGWSCRAWTDVLPLQCVNSGESMTMVKQRNVHSMIKKRRIGSSILSMAKQSPANTNDVDVVGDSLDSEAVSIGFSFSFFS